MKYDKLLKKYVKAKNKVFALTKEIGILREKVKTLESDVNDLNLSLEMYEGDFKKVDLDDEKEKKEEIITIEIPNRYGGIDIHRGTKEQLKRLDDE